MKAAGVPTVPGSNGLVQSEEEALEIADQIGLPVMIKATAGGGGRGMRLVNERSELPSLLKSAQTEAAAAFGNGAVYIEKAIVKPRHIEIQVDITAFITVTIAWFITICRDDCARRSRQAVS